MGTKRQHIAKGEWPVMMELWKSEKPLTWGQIAVVIRNAGESAPRSYLSRLEERGLVGHDLHEDGKRFLYKALVTRSEVEAWEVQEIAHRQGVELTPEAAAEVVASDYGIFVAAIRKSSEKGLLGLTKAARRARLRPGDLADAALKGEIVAVEAADKTLRFRPEDIDRVYGTYVRPVPRAQRVRSMLGCAPTDPPRVTIPADEGEEDSVAMQEGR